MASAPGRVSLDVGGAANVLPGAVNEWLEVPWDVLAGEESFLEEASTVLGLADLAAGLLGVPAVQDAGPELLGDNLMLR